MSSADQSQTCRSVSLACGRLTISVNFRQLDAQSRPRTCYVGTSPGEAGAVEGLVRVDKGVEDCRGQSG